MPRQDLTPGYLRKIGALARKRAQDRAGSKRVPHSCWWPEVERFSAQGYSQRQIATALGLSIRSIGYIRAYGSKDGKSAVHLIPEPILAENLADDVKSLVEFSGDGFERFFNRFSGRILPPHAKEWVGEFCNNINLLLNVPSRHAKTTVFAVWLPVWLLCQDRNHEILIVSKTAKFAKDQAREIADILKYNADLIACFGKFAPDSEKSDVPWRPGQGELVVQGRSTAAKSGQFSIQSKGITSQLLGNEATAIVVDDVTDASIAASETQRLEQERWLKGEVFTRLMPGCHAVVVGQRVHYQDIYGTLQAQVATRKTSRRERGELLWHTICHPAVTNWDTQETLWPDLWDFDALMETYERIGSITFETMFQQNPLPEGSRLIDVEWWERCFDKERRGFQGYKALEQDPFVPIARVVSLDPSPTKFNGLIVADVPYQRDVFDAALLEVKHWQGGMRSIISELERCIDQYHPDYVIIEQSTYTHWLEEDPLFQQLCRRTTLIGHNTGKNKGDPALGVESLGGDVELARISLPMGDAAGEQMSKLLMDEANVWPHGRHDDCLMALWFIKWNFKRLIPRGTLPTQIMGAKAEPWRTFRKEFDARDWYRRQKRAAV